jgi:hypothetical protein
MFEAKCSSTNAYENVFSLVICYLSEKEWYIRTDSLLCITL